MGIFISKVEDAYGTWYPDTLTLGCNKATDFINISRIYNYQGNEIYAEVKKLGLADEVKKKFGKNYTQVGNDDLMSVINKGKKAPVKPAAKKVAPKAPAKKAAPAPKKVETLRKEMEVDYKAKYNKAVGVIAKFITIIPEDILKDASAAAKNLTPETIVQEVNFSDADLKALFKK